VPAHDLRDEVERAFEAVEAKAKHAIERPLLDSAEAGFCEPAPEQEPERREALRGLRVTREVHACSLGVNAEEKMSSLGVSGFPAARPPQRHDDRVRGGLPDPCELRTQIGLHLSGHGRQGEDVNGGRGEFGHFAIVY
jgi:hypothetical protein